MLDDQRFQVGVVGTIRVLDDSGGRHRGLLALMRKSTEMAGCLRKVFSGYQRPTLTVC
jgi:hypothetical protein